MWVFFSTKLIEAAVTFCIAVCGCWDIHYDTETGHGGKSETQIDNDKYFNLFSWTSPVWAPAIFMIRNLNRTMNCSFVLLSARTQGFTKTYKHGNPLSLVSPLKEGLWPTLPWAVWSSSLWKTIAFVYIGAWSDVVKKIVHLISTATDVALIFFKRGQLHTGCHSVSASTLNKALLWTLCQPTCPPVCEAHSSFTAFRFTL